MATYCCSSGSCFSEGYTNCDACRQVHCADHLTRVTFDQNNCPYRVLCDADYYRIRGYPPRRSSSGDREKERLVEYYCQYDGCEEGTRMRCSECKKYYCDSHRIKREQFLCVHCNAARTAKEEKARLEAEALANKKRREAAAAEAERKRAEEQRRKDAECCVVL